jgi:IclR family pca regulon transcriptional regulator
MRPDGETTLAKLTERDEHARRGRQLPNGAAAVDFSEALARGRMVIRASSRERPRMTLSEVARAAGLPPATARRTLVTLTYDKDQTSSRSSQATSVR